jgi:hypothetical protein
MEKGIGGLLESSREEHFTVVLLANAHPDAYVSCCPILKLPPLYHKNSTEVSLGPHVCHC